MDYREKLRVMNYQDIWSKLYLHLARNLIEMNRIEGESALRESIRQFGITRGKRLRETHIKSGLKINLFNLFTYYDLPNDPRFRRNQIRLTPQERLSETLICPIADMWKEMNCKAIGRIYCEEVHHAIFGAYAPKTQTNLAQTLTQDGDDHCRFSVYLRPANMDLAERRESFEEYDDKPTPQTIEYQCPSHRDGFGALCALLLYCSCDVVANRFGSQGLAILQKGVREFAMDVSEFLQKKAESLDEKFDEIFIRSNCPIEFPIDGHLSGEWKTYEDKTAENMLIESFFPILRKSVEVKNC